MLFPTFLEVVPKRLTNIERRSREYLRPDEVEKLIVAAKVSSAPVRNHALVLTSYRHGLRVSEAVGLRWSQIDFTRAQLHINRLKNGKPGLHPMEADELRVLRRLKSEVGDSPWVFLSRLRLPLTPRGANMAVTQLGKVAGLEFPIHFHQLRHSCGFFLANKGYDTRLIQDWLGHQNINHTARYTALAPSRFEGLWR
jgi:integrase